MLDRKKKIIALVIVVVLVTVAVVVRKKNSQHAELVTGIVQYQTLQQVLSVTGYLKSHQQADLKFATSGIVRKINVDVGQNVNQWQALAVIDQVILEQTAYKTDTGVTKAYADLDVIIETHRKTSGEPLSIQTKNVYQRLVDQAYNSQTIAQKNLDNTVLTAPFAGKVLGIDMELGEYAGITVGGITLANMNNLFLEAEVSEDDIGKVILNQEVIITFDSHPNAPVPGIVSKIHPTVTVNDSSERIVIVEIGLTTSTQVPLTIDLVGDADIVLETKQNVLSVPQEALIFENGEVYVLTVDGKTTQKTIVELGMETDEWAEVIGIEEGLEIVVEDVEDVME